MREVRNLHRCWFGILKEENNLDDLGIDEE